MGNIPLTLCACCGYGNPLQVYEKKVRVNKASSLQFEKRNEDIVQRSETEKQFSKKDVVRDYKVIWQLSGEHNEPECFFSLYELVSSLFFSMPPPFGW